MATPTSLQGVLAAAATVILLAAPEALASQERQGPRTRGASENPRTAPQRPATATGVSGQHRGSRGDHRAGAHRGGDHRGHHDRRGYHRRHRGGSHHYTSYHHSYYPRSPFYWYGYYYPFYYGHYAYGYPHYGRYDRYRYSSGEALGALDLDVRPEKAEVYVDGRFVGVADNFDGFPSYLWLEPGTYEIAFYKEGYETVTRAVKVPPGTEIGFEDRMVAGTAVKPEAPPEPVAAASSRERDFDRKAEEWRVRAREYKARKEAAEGSDTLDARGEPGRLFLVVRPGDASVYLDGRFLGTGNELSRLHNGLIVDPGEHEIEVVRPGYGSETKTFSVDAGEELDLSLRLEGVEGTA